jgi:hypothetical protein
VSEDKARSFAERLPDVVLREEEDISHLSDELADILYPTRRPRPFRIDLVFEASEADSAALDLARGAATYRQIAAGERTLHRAGFGSGEAAAAHELFALIGQRPGTEVLVDGRKVPYARELWLPLFWLFVSGEA